MVDHPAPPSSRFLSPFPHDPPSARPSQPRAIPPACFLRSGSPLPPTSAYALAASGRSLGTPSSDIRSTSPSAQAAAAEALYSDPTQDSDPWSRPTLSPTTSFTFAPPSNPPPPPPTAPIVPQPSSTFIPPAAIQSSSSSPSHPTAPCCPNSPSARLGCFWAILDHELRFVYVDPRLQHDLDGDSDQLLATSIYHYVHPADIDPLMAELDPDQLALFTPLPVDPAHLPQHHQPPPSMLLLPTPSSASTHPRSPRPLRVVRSCRFARPSRLRHLLRRDEGYFVPEDCEYEPVTLFLNPIGDMLLLCFFHALSITPGSLPHLNEHVAPPFRPAAPPTAPPAPPPPHSTCGVIDPNPDSARFTAQQSLKLESALLQSAQSRPKTPSSPSNCLDVFQILDSATGAVLFSYPPAPSPAGFGARSGVPYAPQELAYLAMNAKSFPESANDEPTQTTCSTMFKAQHNYVKEGAAVPPLQSMVINYGALTFASFHSGPLSTHPSTAPSSSLQASPPRTSPMIGNSTMRPPPMELIHDSRPAALEIYSPHSASVHSRAHKHSRAGSSDMATPHSAHSHAPYSSHGQPTPQQSPYAYSHHPVSPMVASNLARIPDSPDPYGYSHFSGELSPTMASAANVLGSFHRAHYQHPLTFQDVHQPEQSYDIQGMATQIASQYEAQAHHHRQGHSEFSASSAASSPRLGDQQQAQQASFGISPSSTPSTYRRNHAHSASVDLAAHHLLGFCRSGALMAVNGSSNTVNPEVNYLHHSQPAAAAPAKVSRGAAPRIVASGLGGAAGPSDVSSTTQQVPHQQVPRSCTSCGVQNSPEWRKGPNGIKSLCNACGLRFSRSLARKGKAAKLGGQQQQKKAAGASDIGGGGGPKKKAKVEQQQEEQQGGSSASSRDFYHPPPCASEAVTGFGALV